MRGKSGRELLNRTLNHAQKAGATNKALITFAFNKASQGLYIRHGLFRRLHSTFFCSTRISARTVARRTIPLCTS
jgi:RimJ/RimL family protein N-acetyltransferase